MNLQSTQISGPEIRLPMLIHVSRVRSHVASRITWHSHKGFELLFLLEGATTYEFASQNAVELHGGHFLVVPPHLVHRGSQNVRSPSTICGLALNAARVRDWQTTTFTHADVRRIRAALEKGSCKVHPLNPPLRWLVRRLMEETAGFATAPHPQDAAAALRTLVCATIVEALRQILAPPTQPREFVAAAIAYLRAHLHENVQMTDLVKHLGFGRARMFQMFKEETGLTPNDYLQRLRIEKARELLRQTGQSTTDIAMAVGFNALQYFCTVFRRYTGLSPLEFRTRTGDSSKGLVPEPSAP